MTSSGMDAVARMFKQREARVDDAMKKAVKAGAKIVAERLQEAAPVYSGPEKKGTTPGALRDSIKAGPVKSDAGTGYVSIVNPAGKDARGESLAKIGNVLEYGRSDMAAQPWFNPAVEKCEGEVNATMNRIFKEEQAKAGGGKP